MRLHGSRAEQSVRFTFDGNLVNAIPGETIGAALTAAGMLTLRRTASGEERGLWCGMGACWDCLVTVDGAPVRACMEKVRPGARVESAPATMPPAREPAVETERRCDVLVVGGGPAGLSAAVAAAEAGAGVVVLDERATPGGQYFKALGDSHRGMPIDPQHRRGDALRARARRAGVELVAGALVWGGFAVDEIAALVDGASVIFRPRRLIVAPGAHERPVPIPGWTLPGAMTVGAVQGLVRTHRVAPGHRIVLAGNGPLLLQVACELLDGGAQVAAVVEAARPPSLSPAMLALGLSAPMLAATGLLHLQRLRRAGVPVLWRSQPLAWDGARLRVRTPDGEREIAADACALNFGFVPETGLARALGAAHRLSARWPGVIETVTDEAGRTSLPGLFVTGDGRAMGGAVAALAQGRLAGMEAARELGLRTESRAPARRRLRRARAFQRALWTLYAAPLPAPPADDVIVCRCEEVSAGRVREAIAAGARSLPAVKRATRAGMGRCQGRMCATTLHGLCGGEGEAGHAAPRAPVRPVPLAPLMQPIMVPDTLVEGPALNRWVTARPGRSPGDCDVLVIGGGIVGLSAALRLAEAGRDVVVADRGEPGLAASTANAGSLHVQLLPYEFTEDDPGPQAETPGLAVQSIALWREYGRMAGESLGIRTEGGLMLARTEADLLLLRKKAEFEARQGVQTEVIGPNELAAIAPALDRSYAGAAFCPAEGQGDPLRGTLALASLAWRAGARAAPGIEVRGLERNGSAWTVRTSAGTLRAGQVLNAAGPYGALIGALVGETLPIGGVVQQVIATAPIQPALRQLVAVMGLHLSLKQGDAGHMLIGGGWPGRFDRDGATRLMRRSMQGNLWTATQAMPSLAGLEIIRAWTGLAPYAPKGAIVGRAREPGMFHALTSNGYTLGPIVGRLAAEAMLGRGDPPAAFAPSRLLS